MPYINWKETTKSVKNVFSAVCSIKAYLLVRTNSATTRFMKASFLDVINCYKLQNMQKVKDRYVNRCTY